MDRRMRLGRPWAREGSGDMHEILKNKHCIRVHFLHSGQLKGHVLSEFY